MMSHDEREREMYESRLKASLDALWLRQSSLEEGKEIGFNQGKAIGFAEGEREGFTQGQEYGHSRGIEVGMSAGKKVGLTEGLLQSIELGLNVKFGQPGSSLLARIRAIDDPDRLRELQRTILLANTLQEVEEQLG